jgi:hypothetical protein
MRYIGRYTQKIKFKDNSFCCSLEVLQPLVNVSLSDEKFPYSTTQLIQVAGHLCRAVRYSLVGELGWELHIPWDSCASVYKAIWEHGKKYGLKHAGYRALHSLTSEKGKPLLNDNNPINLFCTWLHALLSLSSWAIAQVSGCQLLRYEAQVSGCQLLRYEAQVSGCHFLHTRLK